MHCLTLYQPYASLLAHQHKRIETRPRRWRFGAGLWVGVHAALKTDYLGLCAEEPFRSALAKSGILGPADLPLGAVLAAGHFIHCYKSEEYSDIGVIERAFGDYRPGRFGYTYDQMLRFARPISARGMQGAWPWKPAGARGHQAQCYCLRSGEERDCDCSPRIFTDQEEGS